MDKEHVIEVVPHYIALVLVLLLVLTVVRALIGEMSFWIELVIVLVVAFVYRPVVQRLGIAPSTWEER